MPLQALFFTNASPTPSLEYYVGGGGPYDNNIIGQNQVISVAASLTTEFLS